VQGYLLDTNILRFWHDAGRAEHPLVMQRIAELPEEAPLRISVISLGEIEYGHRLLGKAGDAEQEAAFLGLIENRFPTPLPVSKHTRTSYGPLRAQLFEKFAPKELRKKNRRPEQLTDPATGHELGIDENDLWIAAQALEHNLVLVTHDKMARLREVAPELRVEDWARSHSRQPT
jgi:tRNA(fMet)-specific endonuclease VapC